MNGCFKAMGKQNPYDRNYWFFTKIHFHFILETATLIFQTPFHIDMAT